jgi:hypothetical protein
MSIPAVTFGKAGVPDHGHVLDARLRDDTVPDNLTPKAWYCNCRQTNTNTY